MRLDALTGLYYMRQRWYGGSCHRFISKDPIGLKGGINLYAYAEANPTKFIDPSGEGPEMLWWILGLSARYSPQIYRCSLAVATSPHTIPLLEALLSPPGYNPISPVGAAEHEAETLTRKMLEDIEPHFADLWEKGANFFRAVDEGEMSSLAELGHFRHPDGNMKDFFGTLEPAEQLARELAEYEKITVVQGKCAYQMLNGTKVIIYPTTRGFKVMIPNSQLPYLTPTVVSTFRPK